MKAEADLHFLQGINQLVGHGWPYSPQLAGEPGWRMYAAAALNAHNPWFGVMPDLTRYLQRTSYALRLGEPANDVALLLPNDDVWAGFAAGLQRHASPTSAAGFDESGSNVSLDESMGAALGDKVVAQVLDAGFNLDFIDADAIDNIGIPYRVLILPNVNRLPVATYERVVAFARKGGVVISTQRTPATAPGWLHAEEDSARLKELSQTLFHGDIATAHFIEDVSGLRAALTQYAKSDMTLSPQTPEIGFMHRRLPNGELYFVANTSNEEKHVKAHFRDTARHVESWDAMTGEVSSIADPQNVELDLEAYESRLIIFSDATVQGETPVKRRETMLADLSRGWNVTFLETNEQVSMDRLASWSEDTKTKFYSGAVSYEKSFEIPRSQSAGKAKMLLDFGIGTRVPLPSPAGEHNMRAYLESPIREAAQVYVNGKLAGVVWHPPYRLDVTSFIHEGRNDLRVVVGNTAINALAGQAQPDYRLLWDRYGMLFVPQDMQNLRPLPSGMLGPVRLIESDAVR
jgi:hypothetical protein